MGKAQSSQHENEPGADRRADSAQPNPPPTNLPPLINQIRATARRRGALPLRSRPVSAQAAQGRRLHAGRRPRVLRARPARRYPRPCAGPGRAHRRAPHPGADPRPGAYLPGSGGGRQRHPPPRRPPAAGSGPTPAMSRPPRGQGSGAGVRGQRRGRGRQRRGLRRARGRCRAGEGAGGAGEVDATSGALWRAGDGGAVPQLRVGPGADRGADGAAAGGLLQLARALARPPRHPGQDRALPPPGLQRRGEGAGPPGPRGAAVGTGPWGGGGALFGGFPGGDRPRSPCGHSPVLETAPPAVGNTPVEADLPHPM